MIHWNENVSNPMILFYFVYDFANASNISIS
jgi:hypothetical protein